MTDNHSSETTYEFEDLITPEPPTHYGSIAEADRMARTSWWFTLTLAICLMCVENFLTALFSKAHTISPFWLISTILFGIIVIAYKIRLYSRKKTLKSEAISVEHYYERRQRSYMNSTGSS